MEPSRPEGGEEVQDLEAEPLRLVPDDGMGRAVDVFAPDRVEERDDGHQDPESRNGPF
jgi:hypothetical protein